MNKKKITIIDIKDRTYEACLDTEYREALAHAMIHLGYVSDTPINLYFGTKEEKKEIERIESTPLDSNQISELIHLMMYEMRNDFQFGRFRPIVKEYIEIAKEMRKENIKTTNTSNKPICNELSSFICIPEVLGAASKVLKENNMVDESREMIERATLTYGYDEAIEVIKEYVELVKEKEMEYEYE